MTDVLENLSNLYTAPHTYTASPRTDPLELSPCWPRWSLYLDFPQPDAFLWSFVGFTTIQSPSINWNMILPSHPFLCISRNRSRNGKFLLQLITLSRKVSVLLPPRLIISRQISLPAYKEGSNEEFVDERNLKVVRFYPMLIQSLIVYIASIFQDLATRHCFRRSCYPGVAR